MRKYIIAAAFVFFVDSCIAQKKHNNFFIGINETVTYLTSSNDVNLNSNTFKDAKLGFNAGYKYVFPVTKALAVSGGVVYKNVKSKFYRQQYDNSIVGDPISVYEQLSVSRVAIPLQGYFNFVNKKRYSIYVTLGTEFIVLNKANRTVDYYIPTPPSGYAKNIYTGSQTFRFGSNDKKIGISTISGIGSTFDIKDKSFAVELTFCSDESKSKLLTLHNIEYDSYFYSKFKGFQLSIGHSFSVHLKK